LRENPLATFLRWLLLPHFLLVELPQFSAESASLHFGIANSGSISQWLHTFEEQGINGLLPKPKGRPTMKPKYP
ncbi:helix-turn-helix domain-containing protein, partial [Actinobacillus pleuropneumoniae]